MNIVVLDGFALNPGDLSWSEIESIGDTKIYDRTSPEEIVPRCAEADIVLTNKVAFTREVISALPRLKYIGVQATGYNTIDLEAATEAGIVVTNIPAYSTDSVAQMVFAHILNITNRVDHYASLNQKGRWSQNPDFCYWDTPLTELRGKTMGIVGLGHTGMATARIALAFGLQVLAFTSKVKFPDGIRGVSMEELLSQSDIISLHCPLTDSTRELINASTLSVMKRSAILINTGRGQLVNESDVAKALHDGRISAYAADVLTIEPPTHSPLLSAPNSFITPHIAWATLEARQRLMAINVANVKAFINGNPQNVVNR